MKREFLQNFKVGDQPLPKEVIDAIMEENGKDIENARKPFSDYEEVKSQHQAAQEELKAFEGVDVNGLQQKISELQNKLTAQDTEWQAKLDGMAFDGRIKDAIVAAKGRNVKAITALLDVDSLKASKNQDEDIKAALEALKKECAYLFETDDVPPLYAAGTGLAGRAPDGLEAIRAAAGLTAKH